VSNGRHGSIEQKCPPGNIFAGYAAIEYCQPRDETDTCSWYLKARRNEKRVDNLLAPAAPRDRAKCGDLRSNPEVQEGPQVAAMDWVDNPPEPEHQDPDCYYADEEDLSRPRE